MSDKFQIVFWASNRRFMVLEDRPDSMVRVHGAYWHPELAQRRVGQILNSRRPYNPTRKRSKK